MTHEPADGESLSFPGPSDAERRLERFEDAWRQGRFPDLDAFLVPPGDPRRRALLLDLIAIDLEHRLAAGEPARVEGYLERYPELTARPEGVAELIVAEYQLRLRSATPAPWEEYGRRFPGFRTRLDALRGRQAEPGSDTPPGGGEAGPPRPRIPGYEVGEALGGGGMGVVYKARHLSLGRVVALKMIRSEVVAGADARALFLREATAVARLRHPSVVQIFELGEHGGQPYFTMEFLEGGSLHDRLRRGPLPPRQAAELLEKLALAVHAAHEQQIVHRDLKPGNVLFAVDGSPRVSDFGLAKHLENPVSLIASGAVVGTPPYMAPEQALGQNRDVGPLSDVYALGAILYECLTGRPPFQAATLQATLALVLNQEPVSPRRLNPAIDRDLETILLTCLQKEPARRYACARALAEDLRRYLDGETIDARPVGLLERGGKWVRRRPALTALLGVSLLLALLLALVLVGLSVVDHYDARSHEEMISAMEKMAAKEDALAEAERLRRLEEAAHREKEAALQREQRLGYALRMGGVADAWRRGDLPRAVGLLAECAPEHRGWEWHYFDRLARGSRPASLELSDSLHAVNAIAVAPDGLRAAVACADGQVRLWAWRAGDVVPLGGHEGQANGVAFSPDGKHLASGGDDGVVRVWDADGGRAAATLRGLDKGINQVAFLDGGRLVAGAGEDGTVRLWDWRSGREALRLNAHSEAVTALAAAPAGDLLASADARSLKVWDAGSGRELRALPGVGLFNGACFSPDGRRVAAAGADGAARVWDVSDGRLLQTLRGHRDQANAVSFHPDGKHLASVGAGRDRTIKVWDVTTGAEALAVQGHADAIRGVCFTPDGRQMITGGRDGVVSVWSWPQPAEFDSVSGHDEIILGLAFSPDGKYLASNAPDHLIKVWDVPDLHAREPLKIETEASLAIAFDPTGKWFASGGAADVGLWKGDLTAKVREFTGQTRNVLALAFSPDGALLAGGGDEKAVRLWRVPGGETVRTLEGHTLSAHALAFSPDGRLLASAGAAGEKEAAPGKPRGELKVWDVATGKEVCSLRGHDLGVSSVAFSPDGTRLASAGEDETVRVWDVAGRREVLTLRGHRLGVSCVVYSPDGRRLATAGWDGTVKLWDAADGRELLSLEGRTHFVQAVAFSPDGRHLASAGWDRTVRLYAAPPD